jgi:hypothetical protein
MTFSEDMRTRLLGAKRVLGNIRNSVGAISDAIAYNLVDGICRPSVVPIVTHQRQRKLCGPTKLGKWSFRSIEETYLLIPKF